MLSFYNRDDEIVQLCESPENFLINVYGETGIGKSRLLLEAESNLREKSILVIKLDLKEVAQESDNKPERIIGMIFKQAERYIEGTWINFDQAANQIVSELSSPKSPDIFLLFDTTDSLQEDMGFWGWLEEYLVGPLVVEGRVHQVFAGRVPVPWRRHEVRREVKLLHLGPISPKDRAKELVIETLKNEKSNLKDENLNWASKIILEFSYNHPKLSIELAIYISQHWPEKPGKNFKKQLCINFIEPYINKEIFDRLEPEWKEILWWASILEWFDPTVLQRYLKIVKPDLVKDKKEYFFIKGISQLRVHHTIVWRKERGDQLYGVIKDIVRHCLEVMDPVRYNLSCEAAAQTMEELAKEFPEDFSEHDRYLSEAAAYRELAVQEVQS